MLLVCCLPVVNLLMVILVLCLVQRLVVVVTVLWLVTMVMVVLIAVITAISVLAVAIILVLAQEVVHRRILTLVHCRWCLKWMRSCVWKIYKPNQIRPSWISA